MEQPLYFNSLNETTAENDPLPPTDQKNAKRPIFTSGGEALCFTWARKRWAASGMNHSFRVNPLVEGFVIEKVVVVGSVQFEI
jgi:hypothetical protein